MHAQRPTLQLHPHTHTYTKPSTTPPRSNQPCMHPSYITTYIRLPVWMLYPLAHANKYNTGAKAEPPSPTPSHTHKPLRHQLICGTMHALPLHPPAPEPHASSPPIEPSRTLHIVATPPLDTHYHHWHTLDTPVVTSTFIGMTPNTICYHPHTGPCTRTKTTITDSPYSRFVHRKKVRQF